MKNFFQIFIVATLCCSIFASCEKDSNIGSMADLLGTYSVTVEDYVIWGADDGTIHDKGTITITQIDEDRVQLRGLISTKGELIDGNLYLDTETNIDSYGSLSTIYKSVLFGGGILTIWSETAGQLVSTPNGPLYPYSSLCYFEGKKVE